MKCLLTVDFVNDKLTSSRVLFTWLDAMTGLFLTKEKNLWSSTLNVFKSSGVDECNQCFPSSQEYWTFIDQQFGTFLASSEDSAISLIGLGGFFQPNNGLLYFNVYMQSINLHEQPLSLAQWFSNFFCHAHLWSKKNFQQEVVRAHVTVSLYSKQ